MVNKDKVSYIFERSDYMRKKTEFLQFKVEPSLKDDVVIIADKLGISVSAFIRMAIIEKLNRIQGR